MTPGTVGADRDAGRDGLLGAWFAPAPGGLTQPTGGRWRWSIWGSIWLVFLAGAFHAAVADNADLVVQVLGVAGLAVFCLAYAFGPPLLVVRPVSDPLRVVFPVAMFALATALLPITGKSGLTAYVFVAVVMIMAWRPLHAFVGIGFLLVIAPGIHLGVPKWSGGAFDIDLSIAMASLAVWGFVSVIRRNYELAVAREELADHAVAEERQRFSRDLHDIVGHSLTAATVKAQLARRLVGDDDQRARAEMLDVETLIREALQDVRTTVAGYREVTLTSEIVRAGTVLKAAGIRGELPRAVDVVPGRWRELFGWVVREAVTNVVRHSNAQYCRVTVTDDSTEVWNDGVDAAGTEVTAGMGLTGLRERVEAEGGRLLAGPERGGWRVLATMSP